jgi:hypothetical protein
LQCHDRSLPAAPPPGHQHRDAREQQWRNDDVQQLQAIAQGLDFLVEAAPHFAQFPPDAQLLALEACDLGLLLGRDQHAGLLAALRLQLRQGLLGGFQFLLELDLLGAEAVVGVAAQRFDALEGPAETGTTAQADQVATAGEVVDGIPDEVAVVGPGLRDALAILAQNILRKSKT